MTNNQESIINSKICNKIKFERMKRNLSQEELAMAAGLNRNTVGNIERGQASPSIKTLEKIAKVFGIEFLELVDVSKVDL